MADIPVQGENIQQLDEEEGFPIVQVEEIEEYTAYLSVAQDLEELIETVANLVYQQVPEVLEGEALMNLPLDIFLNIITRLSIKPLAVCRCVSKTWRNIIHHPLFTNMHHNYVIQSQTSLHTFNARTSLLFASDSYKDFGLCEDDGVAVNVEIPIELSGLYNLLGSCNGLLCLYYNHDPEYIIVCNPVIGEYMSLPGMHKGEEDFIASGFGFDELANKYKVVRILEQGTVTPDGNSSIKWEAQVYTLGSGKWRNAGEVPWRKIYMISSISRVFLNGAIHWMTIDTSNDDGETVSKHIVAFDASKEKFQALTLPSGLTISGSATSVDLTTMDLGDLGGCLCLLDHSFDNCSEIWVMKDYGVESSWVKEYVISREVAPLTGVHFQLVSLLENGNIMLLVDRKWLVYYDRMMKSFKKFLTAEIDDAIIHVGSFISLRDIVGSTNIKHSVNTGMWYRSLCKIHV